MSTIVNYPAPRSSGMGLIVGVLILVGILAALFYGIPFMQRSASSEMKVPTPQINIPESVDVNVKQQ